MTAAIACTAPLDGEAPGDDDDVLGEAHGQQHLRAEDARVADLDDLLQHRVVRENLHAGLRVRVVRGLEREVGHAEAREELVDRGDEVAERQVVVGDDALDLVELGQVRRVERLVTDHTVNRKVLGRLKLLLLGLSRGVHPTRAT